MMQGAIRTPMNTRVGITFPPDLPPEDLHDVARAADDAGLDQLWLWEDCFKESAVAPAAAALAWTSRIQVAIGLLPVPLRNVALTAMEVATLHRLFGDRVLVGVGHGAQDWMAQAGVRVRSPMTLLREYTVALRELLAGRTVTAAGQYVQLQDVTLDWPPPTPPPLLVGAVGARTVALAGELGDGLILVGGTTPAQVTAAGERFHAARGEAGRAGRGEVATFVPVEATATLDAIAARVQDFAAAGATQIALLAVGPGRPLPKFATTVGEALRSLS